MKRFTKGRYYFAATGALVTLLVYLPALQNNFIELDDGDYVSANLHIRSLDVAFLKWAFFQFSASNWHPLTWISHALDYAVWGLNPLGHHLTSIVLHALNTFLVVVLVIRFLDLFKERKSRNDLPPFLNERAFLIAAGTTGLLFGLHPLHVESVAWVAERKDLLCALFFLLSVMAYLRYADEVSDRARRAECIGSAPCAMRFAFCTNRHYFIALGYFIIALMSKPMAVTLPVVLLLMDYWPLGRFQFGQSGSPKRPGLESIDQTALPWRLLREKVPFIALAAASSLVTLFAQHEGGALSSVRAVPFTFRAVNALWAYVLYLVKMVWPVNLAVIYPLPPALTIGQGVFAVAFLGGISILVIRSAKRHPYFLVGWLWYLVTLVPVIGLVQVGSQSMADRYTYLPLIGIFLMLAWGMLLMTGNSHNRRIALSAAAVLILLVFASCTRVQLRSWKDSIALFSHATKAVDNNYIAHESLGYALAQQDRLDEAIYHYTEALRVSPDYERALIGMGNVLVKQGRIEEAISYTNQALLINPDSSEAHFNMGFALMKQGKDGEALHHYFQGLRNNPDNAEIHFIIGVTLGAQGKLDESIGQFNEALRLRPDYADGHYGLGVALLRRGNIDESTNHFTEALRLKPDFSEARQSLKEAIQRRAKVPAK